MVMAVIAALPFSAGAQDYYFRLKNTLGIDRINETVEVEVPQEWDATASLLTDEENNQVAFELTADKRLRFQVSVGHGSTKGYRLAVGTPQTPATLTHAGIKVPSSRDDIAWENDLCAYRMYSTTLLNSEPNTAQGVDVWQKKTSRRLPARFTSGRHGTKTRNRRIWDRNTMDQSLKVWTEGQKVPSQTVWAKAPTTVARKVVRRMMAPRECRNMTPTPLTTSGTMHPTASSPPSSVV